MATSLLSLLLASPTPSTGTNHLFPVAIRARIQRDHNYHHQSHNNSKPHTQTQSTIKRAKINRAEEIFECILRTEIERVTIAEQATITPRYNGNQR